MKNALQYASGDIIFLADQDDVWLPDKIKIMLPFCHEYDLVLADSIEVDSDLNELCDSHFKLYNAKIGIIHNLIGPCCYLGANMCFRKNFLECIGRIPDIVPHDLWIGIMANLKGTMFMLDKKTLLYRRHDGNVSALNNKVLEKCSVKNEHNIKKNNHSLWFKFRYRWDILIQLAKKIILK